jgi:poly(A) polymerase
MMQEDGVLAVIVPEAKRLDRLRRLVGIEPHRDPLLRLAALIETATPGAIALAERLRLSNAQRDRLTGLATPRPIDPAGDDRTQRRALYRFGSERYRDLILILAAEGRIKPERLHQLLRLAESWPVPNFPLAGRDVTALGIPPGPRVGRLLEAVHRWWEENDFTADRGACLERLKEEIGRDHP